MNNCEYEILKTICILCGDTKICNHEKIRPLYKYNYNCEHNKRKYSCRECNGSAFCVHSIFKTTCKDCHGSQICKHGNIKIESEVKYNCSQYFINFFVYH